MEKLTKHRNILLKELKFWDNYTSSIQPNLTYRLIVDKNETNFIVMCFGMDRDIYTYGTIFHFELKGDKVWMYECTAAFDIIGDLTNAGIASEDIIDNLEYMVSNQNEFVMA